MRLEAKKYLYDIREAAALAVQFTARFESEAHLRR